MAILFVCVQNVFPWSQTIFRPAFDNDTPQHVKDAFLCVEFLSWDKEHKRLRLEPTLMRSISYASLKFVPMPITTPVFQAFCINIEYILQQDILSSICLPCMLYASPMLITMISGRLKAGDEARWPPCYSSHHTYRLLKSSIMYIQNAEIRNGSSDDRIGWKNMLDQITSAMQQKITTHRRALYSICSQIRKDWQEEAQKDKDAHPNYERFHKEHKLYSLHIIRVFELHLMMLNGAPMSSGSCFFTAEIFPTDEQVNDPVAIRLCAKFRASHALEFKKIYSRFGRVFPQLDAVEKLEKRAKEVATAANYPNFDYPGLLAKHFPEVSELEFSKGVFHIMCWLEDEQHQNKPQRKTPKVNKNKKR